MNRPFRPLALIRKAILAAVVFAGLAALVFVSRRQLRDGGDGRPVIGFAHTFLHPGVRDALAAVAAEYEAREAAAGRPIRIEQHAIPKAAYPQWLRTQIIGGTSPVIVQNEYDLDIPSIGRYLAPLSDKIDLPNPYNAGTEHAARPWRETFFDGLNRGGFIFSLAQHYGIPISASTYRIFAHRDLLEKILAEPQNADLRRRFGDTLAPLRYTDFVALCEAAQRYGETRGERLVPIAGYAEETGATLQLLNSLVKHQTQSLNLAWAQYDDVRITPEDMMLELIEGSRSMRNGPYLAALGVVREIGRFFQPGFLQQKREDADFLFSQRRALMITASAWEEASFRRSMGETFNAVIFEFPRPMPGYPPAPYALGPLSESEQPPAGTFAIVNSRSAAEQTRALDFLRFLTSVPGQRIFVARSGWLPAITGVPPKPGTEVFLPVLDGHREGVDFFFSDSDLRRIYMTNLHRLISYDGSVETFMQSFLPVYQGELPAALRRLLDGMEAGLDRQDSIIAATWWLARDQPDQRRKDQLGMLIDSSHPNDDRLSYNRLWARELGLPAGSPRN